MLRVYFTLMIALNIYIFNTKKILFLFCCLYISRAGLPTSVTSENQYVVEETVQNSVAQDFTLNKEKFNMSEMMFSKERGGCAVAQENQNNPKQNPKSNEKMKNQRQDSVGKTTPADHRDTEEDGKAAAENCLPHDTSKTGLAPWQEGVLDRLGQELTPQEYNMYVVHHGRMLLTFGQIQACTPRERDFVYGSLEPIPVQTLRSFKVMVSNYIYLL